MKIAWASPLPPVASGIADYTWELAPHVVRTGVEVELYAESHETPDAEIRKQFDVYPLSRLRERVEAGAVDLVVYQLGNHPHYHGEIWDTLCEIPGVVVLHEYMLHHLMRGITLDRGKPQAYLEELRYCAGQSGYAMGRRFLNSGLPFDIWSYPLFERAVDRSLAVLVHNESARRRVLKSRPGARVERIPLPVDLTVLPEMSKRDARERLGLDPDRLVVASFGFLTPAKRVDLGIRGFARLRQRVPDAQYLLVGALSPYYNLDALLDGDHGRGVRIMGRTSIEDFQAAMVATDIAVNLRYPSGGESSGSMVRLLCLGIPTILSDTGSFGEVPSDCAAKIPLDEMEEDVLAAYLIALAEDPDLRRRLGENARRYARTTHTLEGAAEKYRRFLERVRHEAREPSPPVPPLAPYPREDVTSDLLADVSAAACDLGLGEDDEVLGDLAETVVDVGLGVGR